MIPVTVIVAPIANGTCVCVANVNTAVVPFPLAPVTCTALLKYNVDEPTVALKLNVGAYTCAATVGLLVTV